MHRLLERTISSISDRLVILAPAGASIPTQFSHRLESVTTHELLRDEMQRLRGRIYLEDGAIRPDQLTSDLRHHTPEDERSWHLLMLDDSGDVAACLWYLEHDQPSIDDLRIRSCPLATAPGWRDSLRAWVKSELALAQRERVAYTEVGGWASERRDGCAPEGLLLILATFAFSRLLGGALGVTTATVRHSSAAILRRLGLSCVPAGDRTVPAYFDPKYGCDMELLRFDTRRANPKYEPYVRLIEARLADVPVVGMPEASTISDPVQLIAGVGPLFPASHRLSALQAA